MTTSQEPDPLAKAIRERNQARGQVAAAKGEANKFRQLRNAAVLEASQKRRELAKLRLALTRLADEFEDKGQSDVAQALWNLMEMNN